MNSVRSNNVSLQYQSFTSSGCKDIGIQKIKFVAKTQSLYKKKNTKFLVFNQITYYPPPPCQLGPRYRTPQAP